MSGPPYHLRKNKAADRMTFIDAIGHLTFLDPPLENYTYYGFGGSYLEDMRLIYEFHPEIFMVSIERDPDVYQRQDFHRPCGKIRLENIEMGEFISRGELEDKKCIVWLDYTSLEYRFFEEFGMVINKVAPGSMVKITLRADPRSFYTIFRDNSGANSHDNQIAKFRVEFEKIMPDPDIPWQAGEFAYYVQRMIQIMSQRAMEASPLKFYPVASFYYSDGTWILTLTGVIWPRDNSEKVKAAFRDWEFANLTWDKPIWINIPDLSTKERLHIQRFLPCDGDRGAILKEKLGHSVGSDDQTTEEALEQYATFHRYFPYFLRGIP
jgi:hypothetical protein